LANQALCFDGKENDNMSINNDHTGCCHGHSDEHHEHTCCEGHHSDILLSDEETDFLRCLAQTPFLPLAKFVLKSSKSTHLESVALAPVYLNDKDESMESVKKTAAILTSLAEYGLITLDYDEPLENGNYTVYSSSSLYAFFKETVTEGAKNKNFLFDTTALELGSIALTHRGRTIIKNMDTLQFVNHSKI
jgi:hypothetical protein